MCIAIVKPSGIELEESLLSTCWLNNPDGAGFAYHTDDGVVRMVKGFMTFEAFISAYREHKVNERSALIHFRITTRGDTSSENCHPFLTKHGALIHNGTINGLGKHGVGPSDTSLFADMVSDLSPIQLEKLRPMIEDYIGYSRVAYMGTDGQVVVFNESDWTEKGGVLFSNTSYKPHIKMTSWAKNEPRKATGGGLSLVPLDYADEFTNAYAGAGAWADSEDEGYFTTSSYDSATREQYTAQEKLDCVALRDGELHICVGDVWWTDHVFEEFVLDEWEQLYDMSPERFPDQFLELASQLFYENYEAFFEDYEEHEEVEEDKEPAEATAH